MSVATTSPRAMSSRAPAARPAPRRVRVVHTVFSLATGGMENGVVNLCNRLDPTRFAPAICTFTPGGALEARVDRDRVDLFCVPRQWNNDPTLPLRLARELRRRRVDIVHTHAWGTLVEGVLAARLARTPKIVHGEHGLLERGANRRRIMQRWLWPRANQLLSVSARLAEEMVELAGRKIAQVKVVPNGVDADRFRPCARDVDGVRASFGLPTDDVVIGMVARLVPVKNHAGLLTVAASLRRAGRQFTIALAGDGPLRDELLRQVDQLGLSGRVHFLGDVTNIADFYRALDIFVLNSDSEGMSNTILEAMSTGLPVIATDVGSNAESVDDGRTGILVPPADAAALAGAMATLIDLTETRAAYGRAARRRVEDEFSLDRMVRGYEAVYEELFSPATSRGNC